MSVQLAQVVEKLGLRGGAERFAEELDRTGPAPFEVTLGDAAHCAELMGRIGVAEVDIADVLACLPSPGGTPEWWWLLERAVHRLVGEIGDSEATHSLWPDWVASKPDRPLAKRCFMAHVYLATLPHTRAWHQAKGIPSDISWASLSDLGRHMAVHRKTYGVAGVDSSWWVTLSLRGEIFDLGRLQFAWFRMGLGDSTPIWYTTEEADRLGEGFRRGDACIGVHIPESGPLGPELCEESFEMAAGFFAEFFPVPPSTRRLGTCWSWLLDDQLADWLPESSNIVQFQRRFELMPTWSDGDGSMLEFIFRRSMPTGGLTPEFLDELPARTALERAFASHLRAGGHWRSRCGWVDL